MSKWIFTCKLALPTIFGISLLASSTQSWAADGKELYEKKCAKCHGMDGDGKGRAGRGLKVDPTPFKDKAMMSKTNDDEMFDASKYGGGDEFSKKHPDYKSPATGKSLSKEMEAFPKLSDDELKTIVAYVKTLAK